MPNLKHNNFELLFLLILGNILLFFSCASIKAPEGGPRDTKPPKVLNITPKDQTKNFSAKKIVIEFDEYFRLQNDLKEFSISPEQEVAPILKVRQKRLEVELQDSLEKNTTYTLNFGKAIADVNEGNILKNLSYVFSTGSEIDSLSISGKVSNSLTGELEKEVTVFILPKERDSLFGKKRPSIYTLTDSSGNYKLNNLKKGTYKIYALKEANGGDKIYQQISDEIGFLGHDLILEKNTDNINLSIFKEIAEDFRVIDRKLNSDGSIILTFNKQLNKPSLTITEPIGLDASKKISFSKTNDTARIWLSDLSFDSVKVAIKSNDKLLQSITLTRGKKDTYTRVLNLIDNTVANKLNPYNHYSATFNFPIDNVDAGKIIFLEDSVRRTNFELIKDSTSFLKYQIRYPWKQKRSYDIRFKEGAFTAIFNTKNKEINRTFKLEPFDSYTTIVYNVTVPDSSKNYIVQFLNEKKDLIKSFPIKQNAKLTFANYPAGKYIIRVIYDDNKNEIWDTGNLKQGIQPEKIWYLKTILDLKPNWEREDPLIIPPPPIN